MFRKAITKDEVNELDLGKYPGEIVLMEDSRHVFDVADQLFAEDVLGIDTESRPAFRRGQYNPVALLQIATSQRVFLFRLNRMGFPEPLQEVFNNPDILKIGVAPHDDLEDLNKFSPIAPKSVFDLNVYCSSLGFENIGARNLTAMVLGFRISKAQQTSDWEANNLSRQQIEYAATDAWICREIYQELKTVYS